MNDFNDDKIKKAIESADVPEQISPENMKIMLDEKAPQKKRSKITHKAAMRFTAGAAACAVICGVGVHYAGQADLFDKKESQCLSIAESSQNALAEVVPEDNNNGGSSKPENTFMYSVKDYEELYSMFEDAYDEYGSDFRYESTNVFLTSDGVAVDESAMEDAEVSVETQSPSNGVAGIGSADDEDGSEDYSETYNQEEGVLEADIYKTDGEYIYYIHNGFYDDNFDYTGNLCINAARADNGLLVDEVVYDITDDFPVGEEELVDLRDMYLYNDMLIVIGNAMNNYSYRYDSLCADGGRTYVSVYTTDNGLRHVDTYMQDGSYNDVRITPDGYMYLITDDYSSDFNNIDSAEDLEAYIPACGLEDDYDFVSADSILLPEDELGSCNSISYTIVSGLDFNNPGSFYSTDVKAIAGFSGSIYCSGGNLYLASGWEDTDITRIALDAGTVIPAAEGTVKGKIKDQFSMSEYNGYFRIATTHETWRESIEIFDGMEVASYGRDGIDNYVYVLDMDLGKVGKTESFGRDETIKSVSFSGDLAYVVTYEQTDPLFSIDLSNPSAPVILDEFKILGYSTYMQQWSDGLLLGFGVDADENGIENGYKLVMFDNSDPNNLEEVGIVTFGKDYGDGIGLEYSYSMATWDRKALLIAPEKNLIGVPLITETYNDENWGTISAYRFYSYENGSFTYKGEVSLEKYNSVGSMINLERAAYIEDYVYVLGEHTFIAADAATITQTDIVEFTNDMAVVPEDVENTPVESVTSTEQTTEIPAEPTTEPSTEPEEDAEIVFVDRMTNEIDDRGTIIDIDGKVYKYDFCDEEISNEKFVEKLYEICETEEPVMTVDADIVYDCWEKIRKIDLNSEIVETYTGSADMGQSSVYAVNEADELVLLHSEGDYIRENSDAVAKEIYELYFELWN